MSELTQSLNAEYKPAASAAEYQLAQRIVNAQGMQKNNILENSILENSKILVTSNKILYLYHGDPGTGFHNNSDTYFDLHILLVCMNVRKR